MLKSHVRLLIFLGQNNSRFFLEMCFIYSRLKVFEKSAIPSPSSLLPFSLSHMFTITKQQCSEYRSVTAVTSFSRGVLRLFKVCYYGHLWRTKA